MSMALAHFALGAALTTLVVTFLLPTVAYPRSVVLAGGGWAMLPDAHWISPVARGRLHELHETSVLADVFWFHRTLDGLDPTDSAGTATLLVALLVVATLVAERRSYRAPAVVESAYETYLNVEPPE